MSLFSRSHTSPIPTSQNILIDTADNTLVAISMHAPALFFLLETMMGGYVFWNIQIPNIYNILQAGPRSYPMWSYDSTRRRLRETDPSIITDALRERAHLAAKKAEAVQIVIEWVNRRRQERIGGGLLLQEVIYAEKERQAKLAKDAQYDERRISEFGYVVYDADKDGLSLKEAAEEILLQAKLDRDLLAQTEKVRRDLFTKLKVATTAEQVKAVVATTEHYSL